MLYLLCFIIGGSICFFIGCYLNMNKISDLENKWNNLKMYCKLQRHESNSIEEGKIYDEIVINMGELDRYE